MTPETELEIAHAIRDVEDPLEFASEFREHVKAAVAKLEQLGYVIVPKEPTDKMVDAALRSTAVHLDIQGSQLTVNREKMRVRWRAMLAIEAAEQSH